MILPGLNYSCDMPLLYYSTEVMLAVGADVVLVKNISPKPDNFMIIQEVNPSLEALGDIEWSLKILEQVTLRIKRIFHSKE